ncbi:hypothetical protein [Aquisalinus flavus]|uniref:Uncharacterized protein n=1 Tax=Aquisalinus flavus TaxID=1526572 RepID=A0A8J2Y582_9PROT|nr:hypothetical protein [Aquisalinus flavus]MBD0426188.1 hypothetical protein [Aquisalinus flavus]UNE48238.1 hypothetical protein FF099_09320 [Aquisalinus flavus]GGD09882.1 hypothetical protein GCM10011342_18500 [Aquisalinus flavus]
MNYVIALAAGLLALSACATPPAEDAMASETATQTTAGEKSAEKETGEENCQLVKSAWSNRTEKVCE